MIEMFFFVSLAITFVLIVFLVYHFRQKCTALEHKCDTMFEIINNIVKEMNNRMELSTQHQPLTESGMFNPDTSTNNIYYDAPELPKLLVSDSEEESEEGSDDDESDDDESDDDESDDESDMILPEVIDDEDDDDKSVKVINVELSDIDENIHLIDDNMISTEVSDEEPIDIHDGLNNDNVEMLQVEKLEETTLENNDKDSPLVPMDVYRKMNITALKVLVIEKGYASDTNKMKKNELLKLLESSA